MFYSKKLFAVPHYTYEKKLLFPCTPTHDWSSKTLCSLCGTNWKFIEIRLLRELLMSSTSVTPPTPSVHCGQTDIHTGRQAGRQTDRQTGRQADGHTGVTKRRVAFRNFAKAPEHQLVKRSICLYTTQLLNGNLDERHEQSTWNFLLSQYKDLFLRSLDMCKVWQGDHMRCSANSTCARYGHCQIWRTLPLDSHLVKKWCVATGQYVPYNNFATCVGHPVELVRLRARSVAHVLEKISVGQSYKQVRKYPHDAFALLLVSRL